MTFSLILDVRTLGAALPRQLHALQRLVQEQGAQAELLVADDTGDPRLPALVRRHAARLCPCEGTPLGDRLNVAVVRSLGEVLVFPAPSVPLTAAGLSQATERIAQRRCDAVVLSPHPPGRLARLRRRLLRQRPALALCVSRSWYERIGGCDPALDRNALSNLLDRLKACQARIERLNG